MYTIWGVRAAGADSGNEGQKNVDAILLFFLPQPFFCPHHAGRISRRSKTFPELPELPGPSNLPA